MPTPSQPQRRFPRSPVERPVLLRRLGEEPLEGFTKTRVLGLGGCMVTSDRSVGWGSLMEILISFRDGVVKTDGRVAWERECGPGDFEVGVEFLRLAPADRRRLASVVAPPATDA